VLDPARVHAVLAEATRDGGRFVAPLVLAGGTLRLVFSELETLKVMVTTSLPFSSGDAVLTTALDTAREFLQLPDLRPAPSVVEDLTRRVREAFARPRREVAPDYLQTQTERALVEQRRYRRQVFRGTSHVRAELSPGHDGSSLVYVPDEAAPRLPLHAELAVRMVAEVHPHLEQGDSHSHVLRVLALARQVQRRAQQEA